MDPKINSFREAWRAIVEEAKREGPDAVEQLEDFRSAFAWARELALARKARRLSQVEVSKLTGINQGEISKIESGAANPTVQTLNRLVAAYDMRVGLLPAKRGKVTPRSYELKAKQLVRFVAEPVAAYGGLRGSAARHPSKRKKLGRLKKARRKGFAG